MTKYDGCYVRTVDDQTLWLVEKGARTAIVSIEALQDFGPKPVRLVSEDELKGIPLASETVSGSRNKAPGKPAKHAGGEPDEPQAADE